MAENEGETGAAVEAEAAPAKRGKLKLIIAAAGFAVLVGGGGSWFFLMRGPGEERHAEVAATKPPVFVDVPEMMVNLVGLPGERVQYLKVKLVLEVKEDKLVEAIKPTMPRITDIGSAHPNGAPALPRRFLHRSLHDDARAEGYPSQGRRAGIGQAIGQCQPSLQDDGV